MGITASRSAEAGEELTSAQRRRARARATILAAARTVISQYGFREAQVSLIAREAGLAVGSIYRHFPSRTELFCDLYRDSVDREFAVLGKAVEETAGDALQQLVSAITTFCHRTLRGGRLALALLIEPVEPDLEELRLTYREQFRSILARLIDRCVHEGSVQSLDTRIAAAAVLGIMTEVLILPPAGLNSSSDRDSLVTEVALICLAALGTDRDRVTEVVSRA